MNIKHHVLANMSGRLWAALMSFAFVPLYIKLLGVEAYALIGFFTSLLAVFFVLDMGISTTINREFARRGEYADNLVEMRTLLRSLEIVYWGVGLILSLFLVLAAPILARDWLNVASMPIEVVINAIRLMALTIFFRWPVTLYTGALMGLRRHIPLNAVIAVNATLQGGGAVLVLLVVRPSIGAFFLWQTLIAALQIAALAILAWRGIRLAGNRPRFATFILRSILAFSAGVSGITLLSVVLTQLDKVVLSRLLPLETFGYYALATAIANMLNVVAGAVFGGIFPAFSSAVARGATDELRSLYHQYSQFIAVLVIPAVVVVSLFAPELLQLYVGNARITGETEEVLRLLVIANGFLALMQTPLALQLSNGWTRLSLVKNLIAVVVIVPTLILLVSRWGMIGAGITWIALTLGYFLIEVPVMHRRLLSGEKWRWYLIDVGRPVLVSLAVLGPLRAILPAGWPEAGRIVSIGIAGVIALLGSAAAVPDLRAWMSIAAARLVPRGTGRSKPQ